MALTFADFFPGAAKAFQRGPGGRGGEEAKTYFCQKNTEKDTSFLKKSKKHTIYPTKSPFLTSPVDASCLYKLDFAGLRRTKGGPGHAAQEANGGPRDQDEANHHQGWALKKGTSLYKDLLKFYGHPVKCDQM